MSRSVTRAVSLFARSKPLLPLKYPRFYSMTNSSPHPIELLQSYKVEYSPTHINYYRSKRTGLSATLIQQKSPIVNGYFAVASEVHNDSGVPHTLEHLVFMGSKKFPYKGLLDTLGNKMLSSTNAWTGIDQTVYTLGTAGWEGFNALLPIYIDHVLNPTLTDEACLTEVYHIDGNAEEKGVVFSEMQGVENTSSSRMQGKLQKMLYGSESAYSSETGGLMGALRVLTNEEIKDFHRLRYTPYNLNIIVTGDVDESEFLATLQAIDDELEDQPEQYTRPFVDTEPASYIQKSEVKFIEFPELDESSGEGVISWIGPNILDRESCLAVEILLRYLTEEGIGKLNSALVETADPLSTSVDYYLDRYRDIGISVYLSSVPTEKLQEAQDLVHKVLKDTLINEDIELSQLQRIIQRVRNKLISSVEASPIKFSDTAIACFTYGDVNGEALKASTSSLKNFDKINSWTKSQWLEILRKYFVENPYVAVLGKPSQKLYESQKVDNAERTKQYKEQYGEEGLKKLQETLDAAQEKNNTPVPEHVLNEFSSPDLGKIKFIATTMATTLNSSESNEIQSIIDNDKPDNFKLDVHFEHYPSQFTTVNLLLSTRGVDIELLPLIDVFMTELFALPLVLEDGSELDFESAIQKLKSETLVDDVDYGINSEFDDYINLNLQVTSDRYNLAIEWLINALVRSKFTEERLKIILDKYINGLPDRKRSGSAVVRSSMNRTIFTNRSIRKATDIFETEEYFKSLQESLETAEGVKDLQKKLNKVRNSLLSSGGIRVLVNGDVTRLESPVKAWLPLQEKCYLEGENLIPYLKDVRSDKGVAVSKTASISPMASSESSYVYLVGKAPDDFNHEDIPTIAVCCEYLQAVEGPMWRGVRGAGLAYGANIFLSLEDGLIKLTIYRGTNSGEAIKVCNKIITDFASSATPIEEHLLQGAKNSIVHSAASNVESASMAAYVNYSNSRLKGRGRNHLQNYFTRMGKVTAEDVKQCYNKYFLDLFDAEKSMVFIACHTSMTETLLEQLNQIGYSVEVGAIIGADDDFSDSGSEYSDDSDESDA